mmetsp:Transcript_38661/g.98837  ORF Transcript_38661/g.98837 Transcript_38661/m.98837 type:complete len:314 (-) Transcript_38661:951-1892(-)
MCSSRTVESDESDAADGECSSRMGASRHTWWCSSPPSSPPCASGSARKNSLSMRSWWPKACSPGASTSNWGCCGAFGPSSRAPEAPPSAGGAVADESSVSCDERLFGVFTLEARAEAICKSASLTTSTPPAPPLALAPAMPPGSSTDILTGASLPSSPLPTAGAATSSPCSGSPSGATHVCSSSCSSSPPPSGCMPFSSSACRDNSSPNRSSSPSPPGSGECPPSSGGVGMPCGECPSIPMCSGHSSTPAAPAPAPAVLGFLALGAGFGGGGMGVPSAFLATTPSPAAAAAAAAACPPGMNSSPPPSGFSLRP